MKALCAIALLAALTGCAAQRQPFAATWYSIHEPPRHTSACGVLRELDGKDQVVLALLNQSEQVCTVEKVRLNGNRLECEVAAHLKQVEPGRLLLIAVRDFRPAQEDEQSLESAEKKCIVPVSVQIETDEKCRVQAWRGEQPPIVPIPAAFPSSLPETWVDKCLATTKRFGH